MRKIILAILLCGAASAQIPTDTLRAKLASRLNAYRTFVAAHPDAQIVKRIEEAIHFKMADGTYTAILGRGMSYVDPDTKDLTPVALDLYQTDSGYRTVGSPITIRVIDWPIIGGNPTTEVDTYRKDPKDGSVLGYGIAIAPATLAHDTTFSFQQGGVPWTIELQELGWDLRATVAASQGAKTYRFGYREVSMSLDPDASGNLATPNGAYSVSRPVMVRADHITTPCGAWEKNTTGKLISFTCDDTAFPPAAYPYIIDPTGTFRPPATGIWYGSASAGAYDACPDVGPFTWNQSTDNTEQVSVSSNFYEEWVDPGPPYDPVYWCSLGYSKAWIGFDTSSLPAIPTSATLNLYIGNNHLENYYSSIFTPTYSDSHGTSTYVSAASIPQTTPESVWNAYSMQNLNYFKFGVGATTGLNFHSDGPADSVDSSWSLSLGGYGSTSPYIVATYNTTPATVSATPNSGSIVAGTWQTSTSQVSDSDGYADISAHEILFAYGVDGYSACFVLVYPNSNTVALLGDDGVTWGASYVFGTANVPENAQCKIDVANSSRTVSGNTSTVSLRVLFKSGFTRGSLTKHTYLYVTDATGAFAGWTDYGSWTLLLGGPKLIFVNQ